LLKEALTDQADREEKGNLFFGRGGNAEIYGNILTEIQRQGTGGKHQKEKGEEKRAREKEILSKSPEVNLALEES